MAQSIKVFARVRPGGAGPVPVVVDSSGAIVLPDQGAYRFEGGAYGPASTQEDVFNGVGVKLCEEVVKGVNACLMA